MHTATTTSLPRLYAPIVTSSPHPRSFLSRVSTLKRKWKARGKAVEGEDAADTKPESKVKVNEG